MQDDVLRCDSARQCAKEFNAQDLRYRDPDRTRDHAICDIGRADAERQAAQRPAVRGMGVRADDQLPRQGILLSHEA